MLIFPPLHLWIYIYSHTLLSLHLPRVWYYFPHELRVIDDKHCTFCPEAEEGLCSRLSACMELGCFEKSFLILDRLRMELVILRDDLSAECRDAAMCG